MSPELALNLAVAAPVAGAGLTGLAGKRPALRDSVTLVTAVATFAVVLSLAPAVLAGGRPAITWLDLGPGLALGLQLEPLGMLFALVASGLWTVNSLYSVGYMRANQETHQTRFYAFFALAIASALGVAFAANLVTLLVFYEALTLSTYPLVTHHGGEEDLKAGRLYLGLLLGASIGLLFLAILWTWVLTGTTDFRPGGILSGAVEGPLVGILLALYAYGIGKAALMPLHAWLPAAMVAPTPVSALLHAVAVVKAGVFSVVKVLVYTFGLDLLARAPGAQWLTLAAGATLLLAAAAALRQDNLKRRLAYSTVSQLSYVVLGASLSTPLAVTGAALHIAAHAVSKITLFFAAGAIHTAVHKTEVHELDGVGRQMPWTMGAFAVASLSIIGAPPFAGFVGKWFILMGAVATQQWFAVAALVAGSLLSAAYLLPILHAAFFRDPAQGEAGHGAGGDPARPREAPALMVAAEAVSAAATVGLFFFADAPYTLARALTGLGG